MSEEEIKEADFQAYLGSDDEDDEDEGPGRGEEKDAEKIRERYRYRQNTLCEQYLKTRFGSISGFEKVFDSD
jgi:hypothetical protein